MVRLYINNAIKCRITQFFILCLVLVQPRKTRKHPDTAEKLLTGTYIHKALSQTNKIPQVFFLPSQPMSLFARTTEPRTLHAKVILGQAL